jgi:uncharacterized protein (TIGR02001 family)
MDAAFVLLNRQRWAVRMAAQRLSKLKIIPRHEAWILHHRERVVMKKLKVLSALSLLVTAGAANAEVSGSMGIASSYLWRGFDLGPGTPAVSGDLHYSNSGFYGGIWGSSGDTVNGTEYDLYAGWGGSLGPVALDVSYWTYNYPTIKLRPGNLSELVTSVGVGPISAFLLYNINSPGLNRDGDPGNGDYQYYGLKAKAGAFTFVLGHHNQGGFDNASAQALRATGVTVTKNLTHADVSYAYNDNLSFTVSVPVDVASGYDKPADPTFVASYSVPFGK